MKKNQIPAEEILNEMYNGLNKDVLKYFSNTQTLDDIVKTHKHFYFCNGCFIFAKKIGASVRDTIHASAYYINDNNEFILGSLTIRTYRRVLPFMKFHKNEYDEWESPWYKSKQLYDLLPSRRRIIDDILKTL